MTPTIQDWIKASKEVERIEKEAWLNKKKELNNKKKEEKTEEEKRKTDDPFLAAMLAAAAKVESLSPEYGVKLLGKYTKEEKMASCYHKTGHFLTRKKFDGSAQAQPLYCNLCQDCFDRHAKEHKDRFQTVAKDAEKIYPQAKWRKKVVESEKEADSLKKRISRNQNKKHVEIACKEEGKVEVWCLVEDEPNKDMDEVYGKEGDPEKDIDWDAVYEKNRETGQKVSYGGGLRKSASPKEKEDEVKIVSPQLVVGKSDQKKAEDIIYCTNYLHEAQSVEELEKYVKLQFHAIIKNLKDEDIEILAVKEGTIKYSAEKALKQWNTNVRSWRVSANAPLLQNNGALADTFDYLVWPEEETVIQ